MIHAALWIVSLVIVLIGLYYLLMLFVAGSYGLVAGTGALVKAMTRPFKQAANKDLAKNERVDGLIAIGICILLVVIVFVRWF